MARTPYPQTDGELIRRIERSGGRAGYKQLVRELGLGGGRERRLLLEQLARMTAGGALVKTEQEQWAIPSAAPEKTLRIAQSPSIRDRSAHEWGTRSSAGGTRDRLLAGRLDLHRDGYGFVRPNESTAREDDVFIAPTELNGAMQGDEVLVDEAPRGRDGRRSGRIARVLTRRNPTVVGIFHYARGRRRGGAGRGSWEDHAAAPVGANYVSPLDERMAGAPGGGTIVIPEGAEIVRAAEETPHRVLGEEAQTQQRRWRVEEDDPERAGQHDWMEGLAVDVEITDFPAPGRPAKGRVMEVLGPPDAFGVDVEIVIRKHHLPHVFPANVLAEAAQAAEETRVEVGRERRDFRELPIVTIDGETARDFDDAVMVRPLANGNWELQVHIADVSAYVLPGTALDLEARLRGTSVYFPDRAVPMLPQQLSSGMCSLRPDEDRLVLSCVMEIDEAGEVRGYEVCQGVIRSARRMTYTQVQAILDGDKAVRAEFHELTPEFDRMYELALRLNEKRQRRGSIDFDLPEPVIAFDPDGNMQSIVRSERGWSHRLIEEFMLSANECVATWIEQNGIPGIYRIHEMPDPKRIVEFEETASAFGYSLGLRNLPVKQMTMRADRRDARRNAGRSGARGQRPQTHEVPEQIPVSPQMYQKLTAKIAGKPEERILSYLMLRSLKQAKYSEKNEGHFALASPCYTHFTSPIRRYPDLTVHRLVRALLESGADARGGEILSTDRQRWRDAVESAVQGPGRRRAYKAAHTADDGRDGRGNADGWEPIVESELAAIAVESSQAERRADDAERELMEWKKMRFMEDRIGEVFGGIILSCTKYGFFVELDELFIEGLVPIATLSGWGSDERYVFRETDRQIVSTRTGHGFRIGQRVQVLLDRIDRQQRRLQFALVQEPAARVSKAKGTRTEPEMGAQKHGKHGRGKQARAARAEEKRGRSGGGKRKGKRK